MIYFTSDLHITDYRSDININSIYFKDDTRTRIINNWNRIVKANDIVYVLGDVGHFYNTERVTEFLRSLNGTKHLIIGNHDTDIITKSKEWKTVSELKSIAAIYEEYGVRHRQEIVLCHYAMKVWKSSGRGSWQLYGHSHGTLPDDPTAYQCDVGAECRNYTPLSFFQIKKMMNEKHYLPKDYHGKSVSSCLPMTEWNARFETDTLDMDDLETSLSNYRSSYRPLSKLNSKF